MHGVLTLNGSRSDPEPCVRCYATWARRSSRVQIRLEGEGSYWESRKRWYRSGVKGASLVNDWACHFDWLTLQSRMVATTRQEHLRHHRRTWFHPHHESSICFSTARVTYAFQNSYPIRTCHHKGLWSLVPRPWKLWICLVLSGANYTSACSVSRIHLPSLKIDKAHQDWSLFSTVSCWQMRTNLWLCLHRIIFPS